MSCIIEFGEKNICLAIERGSIIPINVLGNLKLVVRSVPHYFESGSER
jgi:hypothetical protein